jgi:hypothetical protein
VPVQRSHVRPDATGFPGRSSYVPARVESLVAGRRWVLSPLLGLPAGPELALPGLVETVANVLELALANCLAWRRGGS